MVAVLEALMLVGVLGAPVSAIIAAFVAGPDGRTRFKWVVLNFLLWPVFLPVMIARRAKGTLATESSTLYAGAAAPTGPLGVAPIPPPEANEDLADVREPVSACPRCGFLGIHMPTMSDGVAVGTTHELTFQVCPRCHYRGVPVTFAKKEDYASFLRALAQP